MILLSVVAFNGLKSKIMIIGSKYHTIRLNFDMINDEKIGENCNFVSQ